MYDWNKPVVYAIAVVAVAIIVVAIYGYLFGF